MIPPYLYQPLLPLAVAPPEAVPPRHGQEVRFAVDLPLEESGFEPSVPLGEERSFRNASIR